MNLSVDEIKSRFRREAPGNRAHQEVFEQIRRPSVSQIIENEQGNYREASVGFFLFPKDDKWHFILLKRHDYAGVHSGQVGLPGGKKEEGESDIQALLREIKEEIGWESKEAEVLTALSPLYIPPSRFLVRPFVALSLVSPTFEYDQREVKRAIHVDLESFLDECTLENVSIPFANGGGAYKTKAYHIDGEVVWGATAMILTECKWLLNKKE